MYKKCCFRYFTSLNGKDPDPYQIEKQDPDPNQCENQDLDPYQKGLDPQYCSMVTWHRGCSAHCGFSTMIPLGAVAFTRPVHSFTRALRFSRWPALSVFRKNYFCSRFSHMFFINILKMLNVCKTLMKEMRNAFLHLVFVNRFSKCQFERHGLCLSAERVIGVYCILLLSGVLSFFFRNSYNGNPFI